MSKMYLTSEEFIIFPCGSRDKNSAADLIVSWCGKAVMGGTTKGEGIGTGRGGGRNGGGLDHAPDNEIGGLMSLFGAGVKWTGGPRVTGAGEFEILDGAVVDTLAWLDFKNWSNWEDWLLFPWLTSLSCTLAGPVTDMVALTSFTFDKLLISLSNKLLSNESIISSSNARSSSSDSPPSSNSNNPSATDLPWFWKNRGRLSPINWHKIVNYNDK